MKREKKRGRGRREEEEEEKRKMEIKPSKGQQGMETKLNYGFMEF